MRGITAFILGIALLLATPTLIAQDNQQSKQMQAPSKQLPSRSADPEYREMVMEATAYCHTGNRTYTGTWPKRGTIAVDPKVISLGTRLWVEGYGYGVAEDTGGLIKGQVIDVFMESESEAIQWGRRMVKVRIME